MASPSPSKRHNDHQRGARRGIPHPSISQSFAVLPPPISIPGKAPERSLPETDLPVALPHLDRVVLKYLIDGVEEAVNVGVEPLLSRSFTEDGRGHLVPAHRCTVLSRVVCFLDHFLLLPQPRDPRG